MTRVLDANSLARLVADGAEYRSVIEVDAIRLTEAWRWSTRRSDELHAQAGDWLLTAGDDEWTVSDAVFRVTYERVSEGRYRKRAVVRAVRLTEEVQVMTLEGAATGRAGDWLVQNPTGECWPVAAEAFESRYERI